LQPVVNTSLEPSFLDWIEFEFLTGSTGLSGSIFFLSRFPAETENEKLKSFKSCKSCQKEICVSTFKQSTRLSIIGLFLQSN
jgi:hypothetical protein